MLADAKLELPIVRTYFYPTVSLATAFILFPFPVHAPAKLSLAQKQPADYPLLYSRLISFMRSISQEPRL